MCHAVTAAVTTLNNNIAKWLISLHMFANVRVVFIFFYSVSINHRSKKIQYTGIVVYIRSWSCFRSLPVIIIICFIWLSAFAMGYLGCVRFEHYRVLFQTFSPDDCKTFQSALEPFFREREKNFFTLCIISNNVFSKDFSWRAI